MGGNQITAPVPVWFRPMVGTPLGLSSHWWYSVCHAHKKREGVAEYSFPHQPWAQKLSQLTRLIKQRVRSYYCHLIVWALRLTSPHTKLDVLTNLHVLLSKPVNPVGNVGTKIVHKNWKLKIGNWKMCKWAIKCLFEGEKKVAVFCKISILRFQFSIFLCTFVCF